MTPEQQQELRRRAQVMLDAADGKPVQWTTPSRPGEWKDWSETYAPSFNWINNDYRIKPREPREFWVNTYGDGTIGGAYDSAEEAELGRLGIKGWEAVHVREVIE